MNGESPGTSTETGRWDVVRTTQYALLRALWEMLSTEAAGPAAPSLLGEAFSPIVGTIPRRLGLSQFLDISSVITNRLLFAQNDR
jgi:hypothetical protein